MSLEFDVLKGKKLLLASASPRRRELLGKLDVAVSQAHLKQVDENYPTDMPAEDVPAYISQKKAAEGCKMSLRGYQNYERGEREPSMTKLVVLADFYEVSIDELVCREWPPAKVLQR